MLQDGCTYRTARDPLTHPLHGVYTTFPRGGKSTSFFFRESGSSSVERPRPFVRQRHQEVGSATEHTPNTRLAQFRLLAAATLRDEAMYGYVGRAVHVYLEPLTSVVSRGVSWVLPCFGCTSNGGIPDIILDAPQAGYACYAGRAPLGRGGAQAGCCATN